MHERDYLPWLTLQRIMPIVRIATAVFFMAHAVVRIFNGTIPQFGAFMDGLGFPAGVAIVWIITISEIVAGLMLIFRWHVRYAVLPLLAIAFGGIILIHRHLGWFVGEHGTGGSEYSVALMILLLVVFAADGDRVRLAAAERDATAPE